VAGFNLGADDYMVKPVSLKELVIRMNRLINRDLKEAYRSPIFKFDKIKFDTIQGKLSTDSKTVKLTKKEKSVLEYFLLNEQRVLTRMEIMDHIWGEDIDPFSNTVNMVIASLREKLGRLIKTKFIHSIHGLGYKFEANSSL